MVVRSLCGTCFAPKRGEALRGPIVATGTSSVPDVAGLGRPKVATGSGELKGPGGRLATGRSLGRNSQGSAPVREWALGPRPSSLPGPKVGPEGQNCVNLAEP